MKDLYIIVEGETELEFLKRVLIPYLVDKGIRSHISGLKITMKGGGHGFNNIEHFKNTIRPLLRYSGQPVITSLIDHYGINSEKKLPNYANCIARNTVEDRISCMEKSLADVVNAMQPYPFFIPNILRHEFETLLLADPKAGFALEDERITQAVLALCADFPDIEEINCTPQGAPSKRLEKIYEEHNQKYNKVAIGVDVAELMGIEAILQKCPRFKSWVDTIFLAVTQSNNNGR